jgi:DNA-binding GntR family transcriptional regulator
VLLKSQTLSQRVYDQLHQRLRTGGLRPGTQLVNRTLAQELGTSTIPVREAIGRLVSEGLLEFVPGAGAFVRSSDPSELSELYDVREALEVLAAAEAARYCNNPLIAELRGICGRFREVASEIPARGHATPALFSQWIECEEKFHTRVVASARNRWLIKIVREVRVISQVFAAQRSAPRLLTRSLAQNVVRSHLAFLDILASRDADKAREWMSNHIRRGRDEILSHIYASELSSAPGEKSFREG